MLIVVPLLFKATHTISSAAIPKISRMLDTHSFIRLNKKCNTAHINPNIIPYIYGLPFTEKRLYIYACNILA